MNYTDGILWYLSWPLIIWFSYKFIILNLHHHAKMERLEELEKKYAKEQNINN